MKYRTHVENIGWQDWREAPNQAGTTGEGKKLEAIEIQLDDIPDLGISYSTHIQNIGWTEPVVSNQVTGTTGQNLAIEAFQAQLYGAKADEYDIWYRLYVENFGWLQWTKNGNPCGTEGGGLRAEAICLLLCKKDSAVLEVTTTWSYLKIVPPEPEPQPAPAESEASKRARVVAVAQSYEGQPASFFRDYYGLPDAEWCHLTVNRIFDGAGLGDLVIHTAWCPDGPEWFLNHDKAYFYRRGQYIPKNGDVIYFDNNYNDCPDHVGFVEGCDGETVTTWEGNTYPQGGGAYGATRYCRKSYPINHPGIYGYGVPDFS